MSEIERGIHSVLEIPPGPGLDLTMQQIRGNPLSFMRDNVRRYGEIVRYGATGWTATLLNRPAYIEHVLNRHAAYYTKQGTPDLMMLKPMLGDGLMTTEAALWRHQRKTLQSLFQRQRVETYGDLIEEETKRIIDQWDARADPSQPIEIGDTMSRLTLCIVAKTLFGYNVRPDSARFSRAVQALNETMGHLDPADEAVSQRFSAELQVIRAIVEQVIAARYVQPPRERDALSMMMEAQAREPGSLRTDIQLRDQIVTLLLAGHETTAQTMAWVLYLLGRNPVHQTRLQNEILAVVGARAPEVDDLKRIPLIWATIQETMRLYPPVWLISRVALVDDEIDGFAIPASSLVCISPYLLHRNGAFWHDPEAFVPERFLGVPDGASRGAYMPFGGGPRQCIGRHFAEVELQLVLATLLQRYRFTLLQDHPVEPEALVTLRPAHGLPMVVQTV